MLIAIIQGICDRYIEIVTRGELTHGSSLSALLQSILGWPVIEVHSRFDEIDVLLDISWQRIIVAA